MTSPDPRPFVGPVHRAHALPQCTNWSAYDVYAIWAMVEREDGREIWKQARAWALMGQLCEHQAQRLRTAAKDLAEFWPPERSPAAQVFLTVVESMAASLDESARAATNTGLALEDLTDNILVTRKRIAELVQERNEREQEYERREREELPWMRGHDALIGSQRADIDQRAQQIMREADLVLAETRAAMQIPNAYRARRERGEPFDPDPSESGPPISISSASISIGAAVTEGGDAFPSAIDWGDYTSSAAERVPTGPTLAGWPAAGGAPSPPLGAVPMPSSFQPSTAAPPIPSPVVAPGILPHGWVGGGARGGIEPTQPTGRPPARLAPASGAVRPGPDPISVTGGAKGATHPMVFPPMATPPASGAGPTARPASRSTGSRRHRPDPDDPWAVKSGTPAVLEPAPEASHDPGPGVIGIDR